MGRRFFQKGKNDRSHHVHILEEGSNEIERHIAFRDYLRANSLLKEKYSQLKERLARQFPNDIESYMKGERISH
ncbi:MAG TPA: hypothetical protein DEO65_16445 [Bacillus bacterium]|uniref:GrpB family protein n=1 Tax=Siminovitchia fordii TaxID=254759 RepID=UPI000A0110F9|nr:hypothetical protein [Bacillus sp. (in: firmicutes)]